MKLKITSDALQMLIKAGLFVCAITIIVQLFPRLDSFKYQYQVGRPWAYELVTAPFDFPIYKDIQSYEQEQEEALKAFAPYYQIKKEVAQKQIDALYHSPENTYIPEEYKRYIASRLKEVYKKGVIRNEDLDSLMRYGYQSIFIVDSAKFSNKTEFSKIYTIRSAYETILNNVPKWIDNEELKSYNLNFFLSENLQHDESLSDKNRQAILQSISKTAGMVQGGERIVDRGEIVTKKSFEQLNSLKIEYETQKGTTSQYNLIWIGEVLLVVALMTLLFLYLYLFRPNIFQNKKDLIFLLMMVVLMTTLASLIMRFTTWSVYIIPFALLPIIVRTFFDSRTALFVHIITVLQVALILPNSFEFSLLQITAGMTAISSLKDMVRRSQLMQTALLIFLNYVVIYIGSCLLVKGNLNEINWISVGHLGVSSLLLLFAYGLIYIFEETFGFLSNMTLVELSNVNSPLMQKFSEVAPGSFQHSLQVANLSTEAAQEINGNALLVRIGALYHDIGKISNPLYYTENQLTGINPLEKSSYEDAAKLIIDHVEEGVRIAEKNHLPQRIVDFIKTHHGVSKTRYFYNSFKNEYPDKQINEMSFTYKGPSPTTKEQAILMMADAVEAASRSLSEYSDESITNLVDHIIDQQIAEGLLKYAKITFMDVEKVKKIFIEKLKTIYHTRVSYPELQDDAKE